MYDTMSQCKLPTKAKSFRARAHNAQVHMPDNVAQHVQVAREAEMSEMRRFATDELMHNFARSRSSGCSAINGYQAEGAALPIYWPQQRPVDIGREMRDERMIANQLMSPVVGGYGGQTVSRSM